MDSSRQVLKCNHQQFISLYPNLSSYGQPNYEEIVLHIKNGLSYPQAGPKTKAPINDKISKAFSEIALEFFEVNYMHIAKLPYPQEFMLKFKPITEGNPVLRYRFDNIWDKINAKNTALNILSSIHFHSIDNRHAEITWKIPVNNLLALNQIYPIDQPIVLGENIGYIIIGKYPDKPRMKHPFAIGVIFKQRLKFDSILQIGKISHVGKGQLIKTIAPTQSKNTDIKYNEGTGHIVYLSAHEIQSQKDSNPCLAVKVTIDLSPSEKSQTLEKQPRIESKTDNDSDDDVIISSSGPSSETDDEF